MRAVGERMPGEPLMVLSFVLGGWVVLRVLLWQSPFGDEAARAVPSRITAATPILAPRLSIGRQTSPRVEVAPGVAMPDAWAPTVDPASSASVSNRQTVTPAPSAMPWVLPPPTIAVSAALAASSALDQPGGDVGAMSIATARWSSDAWLLLRHGAGRPPAAIRPSYGRSQAGAVLRYRLAPASAYRPLAYVRIARALAGPGETELAAGVAGRPLVGVPVSIGAEARFVDEGGEGELRPAGYAVTELPLLQLPYGLRGEAYAQAGYVGGRFATAFVDGQARLDASLARLGKVGELRAGAGVWGGAQKGAARLDLGPSAALDLAIGRTRSRLALDYRFRVAGDAAPSSGPALTISAGF